ncbi:MAG: ATP-binding protein [Saprospiraceae bacterium]
MELHLKRTYSKPIQLMISLALVLIISGGCFLFSEVIGYKVVALILLVTVSLLAMLFDILPVLIASILSALVWNFFFIPPIYTFHIDNAEDLLLFLMYFLIALVNTVLTYKIREAENKARDKEEKENTIKLYDTLLNSFSHEVRTPLSTIIGAIDTLKENRSNLSVENKGELLNEMEIASNRLNRQVENLLNMNRLEAGMLKLKKDWCDINELIFSAIQKLESIENDHKINFMPNENLPLFKLDGGLIEQAIYNLVHNAIQYTPPHSTIQIDVSYHLDNCIITISDNGMGFPESEIKFLFDKFYRLPNSKPGGTGLGLSIAKGFAEAHHGTIMAENIIPRGAKLTITIPTETSFINNLKNE